MAENHYEILGLERGADDGAVRAAYRREAQRHHPDRNHGDGAQARMAAINEARAVLLDPVRRAAFDRTLPFPETAAGRVPAPTTAAFRTRRTVSGRPIRTRPAPVVVSRAAPDWYTFLGIPRRSDDSAIATAVTRLAAEFDGIPNTHKRAEASARLREAWRTLRDPAARAAYDDTLRS